MRPGWLPVVGALVPVHGSGHFLGGDSDTGLKLLGLQGAGLGTAAAGFSTIVLSGASSRIIGPAYAVTLVGLGLFVLPGFADLYGSIFAGSPTGRPQRAADTLTVQLGYGYLHDPQLATHHLSRLAADWRLGAFRVSPLLWASMDNDHQRARLEAAYRPIGPRPRAISRDGSALELQIGLTYTSVALEGFEVLTPEIGVAGRLDLVRLGQSLAGAFAEMSLGVGLEVYGYPDADLGLGQDVATLLLFRTAFGLYLGNPGDRFGEVALFYEHRPDALVGGMNMVVGHVGLGGRYYLDPSWGIGAELRAGAAYLGTLWVIYRYHGGGG